MPEWSDLAPAELTAVNAPADNFAPEPVPATILAGVARTLDGASLREFDAHILLDLSSLAAKGKTATINGRIIPAGVGDVVEFTLAVSS